MFLSNLLLVFICEHSLIPFATLLFVSELHCKFRKAQIAFRSHLIMNICPSPIKQNTPIMHIFLVHENFSIYFDKMATHSIKERFLVFRNRIIESISESASLVIDTIRYKALWHNNQYPQMLCKHWRRGSVCDDSSRPLETFGQWTARLWCTNGSYSQNAWCASDWWNGYLSSLINSYFSQREGI
jgi:hypothetical protein